jgi:hypothetical protein
MGEAGRGSPTASMGLAQNLKYPEGVGTEVTNGQQTQHTVIELLEARTSD